MPSFSLPCYFPHIYLTGLFSVATSLLYINSLLVAEYTSTLSPQFSPSLACFIPEVRPYHGHLKNIALLLVLILSSLALNLVPFVALVASSFFSLLTLWNPLRHLNSHGLSSIQCKGQCWVYRKSVYFSQNLKCPDKTLLTERHTVMKATERTCKWPSQIVYIFLTKFPNRLRQRDRRGWPPLETSLPPVDPDAWCCTDPDFKLLGTWWLWRVTADVTRSKSPKKWNKEK